MAGAGCLSDGDTFVVVKLDRLALVRDAHQIAPTLAAREVKLSIAGSVCDLTDPGKLLKQRAGDGRRVQPTSSGARTREDEGSPRPRPAAGSHRNFTPGKKLTSSSYMPLTTGRAGRVVQRGAAPRSTAPFQARRARARTPCSRCARARWRILRPE